MNDSPLISVIIVVYNAEHTIQRAIESVLAQTYTNIELVIIDGASNDNTIGIINTYKHRLAYFSSEKDNGIYDAMNKGIVAAKGDWLFFLGADDQLYSPGIFENIFTKTDLSGIDFLYGDVEFTSNKKLYGGEKDYRSLVDRNICHQAIFYRKHIFATLGNYNIKYHIGADHDLNIRIFRDSSLQKKYIAKIITLYNDKGSSNNIIDKHFHGDMLALFLNKDKVHFFAPELQQYHFYYGLVNLLTKNSGLAFKHIPASWISGKRKMFYFLFIGKLILKVLAGKKILLK